MNSKYIPGYSGYVPGQKWHFGSIKRGHSEDNIFQTKTNAENAVPPEINIEAVNDVAETEQLTNDHDLLEKPHQEVMDRVPPEKQADSRQIPPKHHQLDGRIINNHNPYVLFMRNNPFSDLPGNYNLDHNGQPRRFKSRFYEIPEIVEEERRKQRAQFPQEAHFSPASGYSGHIPGFASTIGKPFDQFVKERNALK